MLACSLGPSTMVTSPDSSPFAVVGRPQEREEKTSNENGLWERPMKLLGYIRPLVSSHSIATVTKKGPISTQSGNGPPSKVHCCPNNSSSAATAAANAPPCALSSY